MLHGLEGRRPILEQKEKGLHGIVQYTLVLGDGRGGARVLKVVVPNSP